MKLGFAIAVPVAFALTNGLCLAAHPASVGRARGDNAHALEGGLLIARAHWFIPQAPDVFGMLCEQAQTTVEGMEELLAWAKGEETAAAFSLLAEDDRGGATEAADRAVRTNATCSTPIAKPCQR